MKIYQGQLNTSGMMWSRAVENRTPAPKHRQYDWTCVDIRDLLFFFIPSLLPKTSNMMGNRPREVDRTRHTTMENTLANKTDSLPKKWDDNEKQTIFGILQWRCRNELDLPDNGWSYSIMLKNRSNFWMKTLLVQAYEPKSYFKESALSF